MCVVFGLLHIVCVLLSQFFSGVRITKCCVQRWKCGLGTYDLRSTSRSSRDAVTGTLCRDVAGAVICACRLPTRTARAAHEHAQGVEHVFLREQTALIHVILLPKLTNKETLCPVALKSSKLWKSYLRLICQCIHRAKLLDYHLIIPYLIILFLQNAK